MNTIPDFGQDNWKSWAPKANLSPVFSRSEADGETILSIEISNFECSGRYECSIGSIQGGDTYRFEFEYLADNVASEDANIFAIAAWMDKDNNLLVRDYINGIKKLEDGWKCLHRVIDAPDKSYILKVELYLRWVEKGAVHWRRPFVERMEPIPHRKVKVATTYLKPWANLELNLAEMVSAVDKAGSKGADIILLGETPYSWGVELPFDDKLDTVPGKLSEIFSQKARQYNCYIIYNLYESEDGYVYNTAVLIGRNGVIEGKYRKIHLPLVELEDGVVPGTEYRVFDVDFGRIGIMTCFDQWYGEEARILRLKGAEMIFLPTLGDAPKQTMVRAADNGVHIIVAGAGEPKCSRVINPLGEITGCVEENQTGIYLEDIDLDKRYYQYWHSVGPGFGELRSIGIAERHPDTYALIAPGKDK